MRKLIIIFLLIPSCLASQIKQDKYYHTAAGIGISQTTYTYLNYKYDEKVAFRGAFMANLGTSFGKEMYDSLSGRRFSYSDFTFTFVSGMVTAGINYLISKKKKKTYICRINKLNYDTRGY